MSYFAVLGSVMAIHLAAVISPGPNFLIVTQLSIRDSRYSGLFSAWGVVLASVIWSSAALVGVSVLFETATWLYVALKLLGGAYLVYLGVQGWRNSNKPVISNVEELARPPSKWRAFRMGFITNLTNPKAVIFFGSIFAALLAPSLPAWVRGAAVGIVFFNALCWYMLVAVVFSTRKVQHVYAQAKRHIDRAVGGFLALLGLRLMLSSR